SRIPMYRSGQRRTQAWPAKEGLWNMTTTNAAEPQVLKDGEVLALDIDNAARALSISRSAIYNLIGERKLAVAKLGYRTGVPVAELQRVLSESLGKPLGPTVPERTAAKRARFAA